MSFFPLPATVVSSSMASSLDTPILSVSFFGDSFSILITPSILEFGLFLPVMLSATSLQVFEERLAQVVGFNDATANDCFYNIEQCGREAEGQVTTVHICASFMVRCRHTCFKSAVLLFFGVCITIIIYLHYDFVLLQHWHIVVFLLSSHWKLFIFDPFFLVLCVLFVFDVLFLLNCHCVVGPGGCCMVSPSALWTWALGGH